MKYSIATHQLNFWKEIFDSTHTENGFPIISLNDRLSFLPKPVFA